MLVTLGIRVVPSTGVARECLYVEYLHRDYTKLHLGARLGVRRAHAPGLVEIAWAEPRGLECFSVWR